MYLHSQKYMLFIFISLLWCCQDKAMNPKITECDPADFIDTTRVYFQYHRNEQITLELVPFVMRATLDSALTADETDSLFAEYELTVANRLGNNDFLLFTPKGKRPEEFFTLYGQDAECGFGNLAAVQYATPVFWTFPEIPADSSVCMLTDEFLVKIDTTITSVQKLSDINADNSVELVKLASEFGPTFLLKVTKRSQFNALDMGNFYRESGYAAIASSNFDCLIQRSIDLQNIKR